MTKLSPKSSNSNKRIMINKCRYTTSLKKDIYIYIYIYIYTYLIYLYISFERWSKHSYVLATFYHWYSHSWFIFPFLFISYTLLCWSFSHKNAIYIRDVQNRINPIEKPQTELIQTETAKNCIWFGCIWITFLHNRMVWFGLRFASYQPNQTAT